MDIRPAAVADLLREPPAALHGFAARGGVLAALRRSPLVGADLNLARSDEAKGGQVD
jgi:hypothetical protein